MAEKNFYGNNGQFKGSMDDDGRIYDERHRFMGYVKGGRIYDNCNIPHGRITGSGMVVDNRMHEVGQEFGTGFCSPASGPRRQMGLTRADVMSEGRGRDYGAFHLLDRDQRHKYDSSPYDDDDADNNDDDNYSDEVGEEEYEDDWAGDSTPEAMPSRKRGRNGQRSSQTSIENDISGCFDALGGCVGVIFALVLLYQLVKYLGS